jgi:hypothetical protein
MSTAGKKLIPRERLDLAEEMFLAGKSRQRIARVLCEKFGVSARTARDYIARVEAKIAALPKPPPEAAFQRAEAMLLEAYELARDGMKRIVVSQGQGLPSKVEEFPEANVGVMATVATRLAELHGVAAPQKVDITSGGKPLQSLTEDELRQRVAERLAALEALRAREA